MADRPPPGIVFTETPTTPLTPRGVRSVIANVIGRVDTAQMRRVMLMQVPQYLHNAARACGVDVASDAYNDIHLMRADEVEARLTRDVAGWLGWFTDQNSRRRNPSRAQREADWAPMLALPCFDGCSLVSRHLQSSLGLLDVLVPAEPRVAHLDRLVLAVHHGGARVLETSPLYRPVQAEITSRLGGEVTGRIERLGDRPTQREAGAVADMAELEAVTPLSWAQWDQEMNARIEPRPLSSEAERDLTAFHGVYHPRTLSPEEMREERERTRKEAAKKNRPRRRRRIILED